ncbi:uncharacterized protein LOC112569060 [Pomacea canaliculata]|uniref:uncharacterized protein LOC112569060 n=1 Tax=Pomacea canaliculata TaxID=400727 RepID=UPI000D73E530|nr:uncharacterized protein LOC112569060 [Pomacea canaliculata]XP_025102494.1 uncharacterized protein LOC112569060 [Pomacea canaliculata]
MSGKSTLKFLIPESSCQRDFSVFAVYADGTKDKVLRCDWFDKYLCDNAPGYTHTIENDTALITVPRDLKKEPEVFICEPYFQLTNFTKRCFCKMHVPAIIIPGQPGGDSPEQVDLIGGLSVLSVLLLLVLVVVGFLICKYCHRQNSSDSEHDRNVRPNEREPLKHQNSRLKPPRIAHSYPDVEEETRIQVSDPERNNKSRRDTI